MGHVIATYFTASEKKNKKIKKVCDTNRVVSGG